MRRHFLQFRTPAWLLRFISSLSVAGLLLGTLFFAASLSPSLLPRTYVMQGVLSGLSLAAGYGLGVFGRWLWSYLELPLPGERVHRVSLLIAAIICITTMLLFLWQAAGWQNSIRSLMELDPVDSADPFRVGGIAVMVFALVLAVARLFKLTSRTIARKLRRFIPRRVASVISVSVAIMLFWTVINGVLYESLLQAFDNTFQQVDALIEPDQDIPQDPMQTGSRASLVSWEELGRRGREFVTSGPGRDDLRAFLGDAVQQPVRVYIGLNSAETIKERAHLALAELERVNAFDRSVLVIATPTGTGWIDPDAINSLEYLHRGDVASVAVQYSYLPSWLSLMSESEYGAETARAVFAIIYDYWTHLPRDNRPRLYLHGSSLGALNSERAADIYDVIADPYYGALWSGPPFRSNTWRMATDERAPDSPAWLPRFRDGSVIRFTNQHNTLDIPGASWGPLRIVYLQYASDPVTFFEPRALYRQPEWMDEPRGPDVSPKLRWFPVVTMLQLLIDIAAGDKSPTGYGHVYAPGHYIDAWLAVTDPDGWSDDRIDQLKAHLGRAVN